MYPSQFDYYRADTVEEAIDLLADHDGDVELLAGGHSLLPTMKSGLASPDVLIDIGGIDAMSGIDMADDTVTIGATTNYAEIASSEDLQGAAPALADAVAAVGDIQVRNRGTIGGNLAHADPAADPPAAALASNATIHLTGPDGDRRVDADDFFIAMYTTDVAEGELVTAVEIPTLGAGDAGAYVKKASPSSGYAMVGVAARLRTDGDTIDSARVAANGALDHATRLAPVEDHLEGRGLDDGIAGAAAEHATDDVEDWELMDDIQASAEYRAQLLEVYTERALARAVDRAAAD